MRSALSHKRPAGLTRFWFGCAYYPEHWDTETRRQDADRMEAAGMNVVRMGEFAWDIMEPEEGKYDFSFFEDIIDRLAKRGISTILCTPTAAPPRWLTVKHPEIVRVDASGVKMIHGSRQHCCHSNQVFRSYSQKITAAMAQFFARNRHVAGWQTDNELNCHFSECHCPACQQAFRLFLQEKYRKVETLNAAWGTAFWAQTYTRFDDITTPVQYRPAYANPAHVMDYYRFLSGCVTAFQHEQVEILRKAKKEWFLFHNGWFNHVDYRGDFTRDLDLLGYDLYPQFCADSAKRRFQQAFDLDRARSFSGNFIIPEQQSGPGGQYGYLHDTPEPGEVRKMTYVSIARGADSLMYFRWRTCRFGAEEYWCGILDHDNIPRRRYEEVSQVGRELKRIGAEILGTSVYFNAGIATGDFNNREAHHTLPFGLPGPDDAAYAIHTKCMRMKLAVGCVHPSDDLSDLALYIIPHWVMIDRAWISNLTNFVKNGGTLVIGARTGTRDFNNNVIAETPPGLLARLCGATVEEYSRQNDTANRPARIALAGQEARTEHWLEVLKPTTAQVVATWKGRHLEGRPAVTLNKLGKGRVLYVGTYFAGLTPDILLPYLKDIAGLKPLLPDMPDEIETVLRKQGKKHLWFLINHGEQQVTVEKPPEGLNLITGRKISAPLTLASRDVAVIRQES